MNTKLGNFINGEWSLDGNGEFLNVHDKYDQKLLARLPFATEADVEKAISSAQTAFGELKKWSAGKRSEFLQKIGIKIKERSSTFVDIIIKEAGKPRSYAEKEVQRALMTLGFAVSESLRYSGEIVPIDFGDGEGKTAYTKRFPVGPVLCITPFNFPLNLVLHKVAPALAVGCPVLLKPAPQTPLSALLLAEIIEEVGSPNGSFNLLNCSLPLAEKMVREDRLAMVSFTGSENVGWHLKNICGRKKITLELGGNAAVIIDQGTPLTSIAKSVAIGAYLYAGQICISTQRIYVHQAVFQEFLSAFLSEIQNLPIGDPHDSKTSVGPLIDSQHLYRIQSWVEEAKQQGATVLIGGQIADEPHHIFQPTLLTHTHTSMKVVAEEVFGPVAIIESFNSMEEAFELVNQSKFGLQVGVFTSQLDSVKKAHELLEVGGILINNVPGFRMDNMPYGGVKMSGFGREGTKYAMDEMTEPRLMVF